MNETYYKKYKNKRVAVGIQDYTNAMKIFWLYGYLLEVTRIGLVISSRDGFQRIDFEDIRAFHLDNRRG